MCLKSVFEIKIAASEVFRSSPLYIFTKQDNQLEI